MPENVITPSTTLPVAMKLSRSEELALLFQVYFSPVVQSETSAPALAAGRLEYVVSVHGTLTERLLFESSPTGYSLLAVEPLVAAAMLPTVASLRSACSNVSFICS